jgi:hypothetical protein
MMGNKRMLVAMLSCFASGPGVAWVASAQRVDPGIGVGVGFPTGKLGEHRRPGPVVNAYALIGSATRTVRLQVGVEGAWFSGKPRLSAFSSSAEGDLRMVGLIATVLIATYGDGIRPYLALGGGLQYMSVENRRNPYGSVPALRGGIGLEAPWGKRSVRAEVHAHGILSDFGTGRDFVMGTYVPVTISLQF